MQICVTHTEGVTVERYVPHHLGNSGDQLSSLSLVPYAA